MFERKQFQPHSTRFDLHAFVSNLIKASSMAQENVFENDRTQRCRMFGTYLPFESAMLSSENMRRILSLIRWYSGLRSSINIF